LTDAVLFASDDDIISLSISTFTHLFDFGMEADKKLTKNPKSYKPAQ
jgi:hypothetical protein